MSEEGSHEFQLNGKQLVFLFMAATVVAVVIFLCGVMVGRGVPARAASLANSAGRVIPDPTAAAEKPPVSREAADAGRPPGPAEEVLTYPDLLRGKAPLETLTPPVEPVADVPPPAAPRTNTAQPPSATPVPVPARPLSRAPVAGGLQPVPAPVAGGLQASGSNRTSVPATVPAPRPGIVAPPTAAPLARTVAPAETAAIASLSEPAGTGFVVQVAAVRQRAEADTIARRLTSRGYRAFVTTSGANFRVRVGKYDDRRDAESIAGKLEKEERFKPWITR